MFVVIQEWFLISLIQEWTLFCTSVKCVWLSQSHDKCHTKLASVLSFDRIFEIFDRHQSEVPYFLNRLNRQQVSDLEGLWMFAAMTASHKLCVVMLFYVCFRFMEMTMISTVKKCKGHKTFKLRLTPKSLANTVHSWQTYRSLNHGGTVVTQDFPWMTATIKQYVTVSCKKCNACEFWAFQRERTDISSSLVAKPYQSHVQQQVIHIFKQISKRNLYGFGKQRLWTTHLRVFSFRKMAKREFTYFYQHFQFWNWLKIAYDWYLPRSWRRPQSTIQPNNSRQKPFQDVRS